MLDERLKELYYRNQFMGCDVHCITRSQTIRWLANLIEMGQTPVFHTVINAAKVVKCHTNHMLMEAVNAADIVNADGQAIVWFGRLSGVAIPERVTGIDLMSDLLDEANRRGWRIYLWGGTQAVVTKAVDRIRLQYPNLGDVCGRNGYFLVTEEEDICDEIAAWHPDILFLGMDTPHKELLAHAYLYRLNSKLVMGVGGAFDIWAGVTKRAPILWQNLGFEWLFRFLQEPSRLWKRYIIGNLIFMYLWIAWIKSGKPTRWENHL